MGSTRPEYFYHPAVGVIAPASLSLFRIAAPTPSVSSAPKSFASSPSAARISAPPVLNSVPPAAALAESRQRLEQAQEEEETMPHKPSRKATWLTRTDICAVTGKETPISQMIRFVVAPDKSVVVDLSERLPGPSLWVTADHGVLQKAIWRNSFASATRETVSVPKDLIEHVIAALNRQAFETLSLARRSGSLVQGFSKVEETLRLGVAGAYVVGRDASENGREKLQKLAKDVPVVDLWTVHELSHAIGEENTVHIALAQGGLTPKLLNIAQKLTALGSDQTR